MILSLSSILTLFPLNSTFAENLNGDAESDVDSKGFLPVLSQIGEDTWWNASYQWRQCINITNPGTFDLVDNIIKIEINWKNLYDDGHLQDDLDDIRIVENGVIRNYYIRKDFPTNDMATIWFETNSSAGSREYDTYIYYGNDTLGRALNYYMDNCPDGIARWEFEEGSGNMAYDSMNNYHGTLRNMDDTDFTATPGLQGDYALDFDGSNDFISLNMSFNSADPDYQDTTLTGPVYEFTASAWVKIGLNLGGWSILDFDRSEYFTFAAGTAGYRATDGHVEFDITNDVGNTNDWLGSTLIDEDGEWHHCVVRFDYSLTNDKAIYVDGGLDIEYDVWNGLPLGDISETRFGFIGDGSEATTFNGARNNWYFEGMLDDVRYFDYALSDNEINWLANYYPMQLDLLGEVERAATVTILVKDVDDRVVPGAEVSLWKNLTHILTVGITPYTEDTLSDGTVEFAKVPFGAYNITVNYTTTSGSFEKVVYDSRLTPGADVDFSGLIVSANVTADLWTIDFEVDDRDLAPLDYGYVNVGNDTIHVLDTIPLDSAGEATFRWLSTTSYNYTIYYDNPDYYTHPTYLNSSTITRTGPMVYRQYVKTNMSKLNILVMDNTGTERVTGVTIKVQLNNTSTDVVELVTDTTGYGFGDLTKDFGFWYLTEQAYNFSLWIIGQQQDFKVNTSDKWTPDLVDYYNYTLDQTASLVFYLDGLNFTQRIANFTNIAGDTTVIYGEDMTFSLTYETSDNAGQLWTPDWNEGGFSTSATWTIYSKLSEELFSKPMDQGVTTGSFTTTVNSNMFSAGDSSEFYYILVSGYKPFWNDPIDAYFGITILARPADITLHNYTSMPDELPKNFGLDYEISEYYGYTINVTARFYDEETSAALAPETFTYEWDYGSGAVLPGPLPSYYTFSIDTSDATNIGKYRIDLTATLENYSQITDFGMYINIIARPTIMNESSGLLYVSEEIFIFDTQNFTFNYVDYFSSNPISNLDEKSYVLQKLDDGEPIQGTEESGSLVETIDNTFVLDIFTEFGLREDGEYSIIVTLGKLNYEHRIAIISLTIEKRIIEITWDEIFTNSKVEIDSGAALQFTLTLTDPYNETVQDAPIIGATGYLSLRGLDYPLIDNGDGTYTVTTFILANAFFMPETLTGTLTIERQYFLTESEGITVVVKMQELFGMPMFYFLMIVGAVVAVVGSLATYRLVQQSRIPTFVKKARSMKKDIKGKKTISESLLYPSKEEYLVKLLGEKWEAIGLSLENVMGITKKKKLPAVKEEKPRKLPKMKEEKVPEPEVEKEEKLPEPEVEKEEEVPEEEELNESEGGNP
jgi:hypothetical protein